MSRLLSPAVVLSAVLAMTAPAAAHAPEPADPNRCNDPRLALRCPDLVMAPPSDLRVQRVGDRVRLLAENRIVNVGQGPLELRAPGAHSPFFARATQVVRRTDGRAPLFVPQAGLLFWKAIPGQGHYWKYWRAARFELWTQEADGSIGTMVRTGPKLTYCFRDLRRARSWRRTPRHVVYPACSEDHDQRPLRLGLSPGWADVYPAGYHENWVSITGLRGCFVFAHRADPDGDILESSEADNVGTRVIELPPRQGRVAPRSCPPER
jgi:hypothetical protein